MEGVLSKGVLSEGVLSGGGGGGGLSAPWGHNRDGMGSHS